MGEGLGHGQYPHSLGETCEEHKLCEVMVLLRPMHAQAWLSNGKGQPELKVCIVRFVLILVVINKN